MATLPNVFEGSCHCGAIGLIYHTAIPPEKWNVRGGVVPGFIVSFCWGALVPGFIVGFCRRAVVPGFIVGFCWGALVPGFIVGFCWGALVPGFIMGLRSRFLLEPAAA